MRNVPDDWDCYWRTCPHCKSKYHASEGGCDCRNEENCHVCQEACDVELMRVADTQGYCPDCWRCEVCWQKPTQLDPDTDYLLCNICAVDGDSSQLIPVEDA